MISIDAKNKKLLLEALEELMYKLSLQLSDLKGGPMDKQRKALTPNKNKLKSFNIKSLYKTN